MPLAIRQSYLHEKKGQYNDFMYKSTVFYNGIEMMGMLATEDIAKLQCVCKLQGKKSREKGNGWYVQFGGGWYIKQSDPKGLWVFINHSCNPNCQLGPKYIHTLREIRKDQELTISYIDTRHTKYDNQVKKWLYPHGCACSQCGEP